MKFGTDGIRGTALVAPIDADGARRVGRAALRWAQANGDGHVWVARDTRPSGPLLAQAVLGAVADAGGIAHDLGVLSSPALSAVVAQEPGVGVMITASHNPAEDNGFKMLRPDGGKPDDAMSATLEAWLAEPLAPADGGLIHNDHELGLASYERALGRAAGDLSALAGRTIALDLAHGAASVALPLLRALTPHTRWVVRGGGDGVINEGVGSQHPQGLAQLVLDENCDAGLAVDGDADRGLLVDEKGHVLPGDALLWLLAKGMGVRSLAITVMSNAAMEPSLPGVAVQRTPVGDRHVGAAMARDGVPLGGEESGHVLFGDGLPGGDGLLTGLRALQLAWQDHETLSAATRPFVPFPRKLTKVKVAAKPPLEGLHQVQALVQEEEERLGDGRVFLRYSGTEPALRVLVEGRSAQQVAEVSERVTHAMTEWLG